MDTRGLIDPALLPLLDAMPTAQFSAETLPLIRQMSEARFDFLGAPALQPAVITVAGPGGPLDIYWYDPDADAAGPRPALLHIHGGGMVIGSARSMQHGPAAMAKALGIPVASVDYRLAPEHPFPAPQDDCYAALDWLAQNAAARGIDPGRIGIIGESAGGGLAASLALIARDRGGPRIAAQFLVYPMLDHRTGGSDCQWNNPSTGEFVWTRDSNRFGWAALQGGYALDDERIGWFSPARAESLAGLPPCWIGTGSLDLFLDENLDYARRLIAAGVSTELHCYAGAPHAFQVVAEASVTQAFYRDMYGAISRALIAA